MFDVEAALQQLAGIVKNPNSIGRDVAIRAVTALNMRKAWVVPCRFQETGPNEFLARVLWEEVTVYVAPGVATDWKVLYASFSPRHPEGIQKDEGVDTAFEGWMVISGETEDSPVRRQRWWDTDH